MGDKARSADRIRDVVLNRQAALSQAVTVMKPGRLRPRGPVVTQNARMASRARRRPSDALLGTEALEAPMPGSLLVLLSRLHRSERQPDGGERSAD